MKNIIKNIIPILIAGIPIMSAFGIVSYLMFKTVLSAIIGGLIGIIVAVIFVMKSK